MIEADGAELRVAHPNWFTLLLAKRAAERSPAATTGTRTSISRSSASAAWVIATAICASARRSWTLHPGEWVGVVASLNAQRLGVSGGGAAPRAGPRSRSAAPCPGAGARAARRSELGGPAGARSRQLRVRAPAAGGSGRRVGDRRLSLVRRLGPRHDDRAARADARHRPLRHRAPHPARRSRASSIRACCPTSSRAPATSPSTTRSTRRSGTSKPGAPTSRPSTTSSRLRAAFPVLRVDRRLARQGHALRHRHGSRRWTAARRRGRRAAHLDGREGRRLGGDAAHRQAGGDQRAVVQRARRRWPTSRERLKLPCGALSSSWPRGRAPASQRFVRAGRRRTLRRASTVRDGDDATLRPNQIFAVSLPLQPARRASRSAASCDVVGRELLTSYGLRSPRTRPSRTTGRTIGAACGSATAPITRDRCGRSCSGTTRWPSIA